eukprot:gi/632958720/ref/XP_007895200.1/ PREDICTED: uncharacterized protein C4orf21 homolog [Callorhinchus milii]
MYCREFVVLYTHQKTKKAKTWHDGILKISSSGSKATLFDEKGLCLDYVHVKPEEIKSGDDLESDRYLITVEEEKAPKNDQAACPHQKEAPKLGTISKRPAIPTRCHLPVGLKRKYTGFQGPREIQSQKKVTVEEKDIVGVVMKSQEHSLSLPPQFYATSPLFSTSYMKERMTSVSGVSALPSVKDSTANLSREVASISSLPTAPYSNSIQKSNPKEEIHAFYSTAGPRIPQTSSIKGLCQKLQFTVANSRPGAHPHPEGVQENRRSKAQILALIDLSALPSPDVLETFNTKQQKSLPRGRSTTCTVENATSHPGVSCFDRSCSVIENESPRLEETRDAMESHDSSDSLMMDLSVDMGGSYSYQNRPEVEHQCEEDNLYSSNAIAGEESTDQQIDVTADSRETSTTEASEKPVKAPFVEVFSDAGFSLPSSGKNAEETVVPNEPDSGGSKPFADISFDLLDDFILDEMRSTDLCTNNAEKLLQPTSNSCTSYKKLGRYTSAEEKKFGNDLEASWTEGEEMEMRFPVAAEEENISQLMREECCDNIKPGALLKTESSMEAQPSPSREIPVLEAEESRTSADVYPSLPEQEGSILLLKSLSEHVTALESLKKLTESKHFEDSVIKGGSTSALLMQEEIPGALSVFESDCPVLAVKSLPAGYSWAPAEATGSRQILQEHVDDYWPEAITTTNRLLRPPKLSEPIVPPIGAPSFHEQNLEASEDICLWDEDDHEPILSSKIPAWLSSPSASESDFGLTQWPSWDSHKVNLYGQVNSPVQQVPSVIPAMSSIIRHSRDNLLNNVEEELEFSVPSHRSVTSGPLFGKEELKAREPRIRPALRLRSPLVTVPLATGVDWPAPSSVDSFSDANCADHLEQSSTVYSLHSIQGCSRGIDASYNNTDVLVQELEQSVNPQVTFESQGSKWLKYENSAQPSGVSQRGDGLAEGDHNFSGDVMFEMPTFEERNRKFLEMQKHSSDSLCAQLIKEKLVNQHGISSRVNLSERTTLLNAIPTNMGHGLSNQSNNLSPKGLQNLLVSELSFPRAQVLQGTMVPKRQVTIPVTFLSPAHYRQVFTAALTEHLNILLYELSLKLHRVLSNVDLTQYSSEKSGGADIKQSFIPLCQHQQPAKLVMVKKEGPNKGRLFYTCDASKSDQCKFFKWLDNVKPIDSKQETGPQSKLMLADAKSISAFIRSQHIHFYGECQLHVRRRTFNFHNRKFCRGKLKELRNDEDLENTCQPKLYLRLSRKENSSVYSRDDLWIVSKTLAFDPLDTFIACSVFFGPSSANEVEILPLKGYSPSNWPSDMIVHALFVGNASTEFTSLRNLQEHVNPASLPLMPYLLKMSYTGEEAVNRSARGRFNSPALKRPMPQTRLLCPETTLVMAMEMMHVFHLNPDQAAALRQIAIMMASSKSPQESVLPITVIHGVYGAGKSYLLAVVVLFLSQLFEESECVEGPRQVPWKLLISSSTNVAVDRVLLGLLNLGFDRFIRVGSIRKIAKPILPYSLHAGSDNEELRELQALLKEDLTPVEKVHVRKSIEQHKLGRNKAMLREVRVVGVTCAACPFQCLNNLSFPMVVLDECSQMTEPSSLLPIARFGCEKLILVGDPKQLQPTIQGSDSAHEAGLEQTLFDRMCLMGHTPILLRTQYRCHPSISAITNELFYDGLLMDGVSASDRTPLLDWLPTLCFYSVKGREQVERDSSFHNSEEAAFTVKLIQSLIASGIEGSMIGVITLYKSQMHKLCALLNNSADCEPAEMKAIQVSTVDAFQGAEKEIIVLSCVRTHQVGFIDSEKRMNVALTRGKRHLQIVGNLNCLRSNKLWERVIHHCEVKENGLKHAYQCEQELDMILKSYGDKRIDEKTRRGQKKLKSRSKSREHIEDVKSTENAEESTAPEVQHHGYCPITEVAAEREEQPGTGSPQQEFCAEWQDKKSWNKDPRTAPSPCSWSENKTVLDIETQDGIIDINQMEEPEVMDEMWENDADDLLPPFPL